MTAVLIHGNPETPAVWRPLLDQLDAASDAVHLLHLPGFGCAIPDGFDATKESYVAWVIGELERIVAAAGPVDLVGHDWGGGFSLRVACLRPDLLRSWVTDVAQLFDPDYVWHDFAQLWQTPGTGEDYFTTTLATPPDQRIEGYLGIGIQPRDVAAALVDAADELMGRCILALYRSAMQPELLKWGADVELAAARPGMVLINEHDPFVRDHTLGRRVAIRAGARIQEMPGVGHWWMLDDPARGAAVLRDFWTNPNLS
jgi:pimeloyl-ACP methyl ester carboxylesterase